MKRILFTLVGVMIVISFLFGCVTAPSKTQTVIHKIEISVAADSPQQVVVSDGIRKSMMVPNQQGSLSALSFILGNRGYIQIYSALSVGDVRNIWNDFLVLKHMNIFDVDIFINSPGGSAFAGLALANHIMRAQANGFKITAYASGIVASAAVPVFAVCETRVAAPGTFFMVHEATLWKAFAQEKSKDLESQLEMMKLLKTAYLNIMTDHSKLKVEEWKELEYKTTWFSAEKAKDWGLVDRIE